MLYLQDLTDGLEFDLGCYELSREEMLDFSKKYDPQSFHLDDAAAEKLFGGLIASGWQTASIGQRLVVDNFLGKAACLASPGCENVGFHRPVFAGDVLKGKLTILETKPSSSKPDRGTAKLGIELTNGSGDKVLSVVGIVMVARRQEA